MKKMYIIIFSMLLLSMLIAKARAVDGVLNLYLKSEPFTTGTFSQGFNNNWFYEHEVLTFGLSGTNYLTEDIKLKYSSGLICCFNNPDSKAGLLGTKTNLEFSVVESMIFKYSLSYYWGSDITPIYDMSAGGLIQKFELILEIPILKY